MLAVLVLAFGWTLAWPFRKATGPSRADLAPVPATNLDKRLLGADPPSGQPPTAETAALASGAKIPGRLIPWAHSANSPSTGGDSSLAMSLQPTELPSQSTGRPQYQQVARPVIPSPPGPPELGPSQQGLSEQGLSQQSLTTRLSGPKPEEIRRQKTPGLSARRPSGLPTHMPSHYEPEYAFQKITDPTSPGSTSPGSEPLPESTRSHPAYSTANGNLALADHAVSHWPHEILHEVQNSDTLEKLASRYLGDQARALEIFDLNRDKLKNPELLPIGAELRIPVTQQQTVD